MIQTKVALHKIKFPTSNSVEAIYIYSRSESRGLKDLPFLKCYNTLE